MINLKLRRHCFLSGTINLKRIEKITLYFCSQTEKAVMRKDLKLVNKMLN